MEKRNGFTLFEKNEVKDWLVAHDVDRVINLIQNHHTYLPDLSHFDGQNHFARLVSMRDYHVNNNGWSDIAQNITTFPDGKIAICRSMGKSPAGIKGHNLYGICIEHLGNFDKGRDTITEAHKDSIVHVNALLCRKFNLTPDTETIVYHHWYDLNTGKRTDGSGTTKSCPGTNFFEGNSVESAKRNFIPLIVTELQKLKRNVPTSRPARSGQVLGRAIVTADRLNIRKGPNIRNEKMGFLNRGSIVDIYEQKNGWCRIGSQNKWISKKYLRKIFFGRVTASSLRVRTGPSTDFRIIDHLSHGDEVTIYEFKNNWCKIDLNEKWVSEEYIKLDK